MTDRQTNIVVLIGYRGSGKTAVGRLLAERLGWAFVDTDSIVETEAGLSIAEIFAARGEADFRRRESAIIARVADAPHQVISAGGGAVSDPANVAHLRRTGRIVWLTAPAEVLWERIRDDPGSRQTRPDLTETGGLDEVRRLLAAREPGYRQAADLSVSTQDRSPHQVAAAVERAIANQDPS